MSTAPLTGVELDPDIVLSDILAVYIALGGQTLDAADPRRLQLSVVAYISSLDHASIEAATRQNLVGTDADGNLYATGDNLEALAAFVGLTKLLASASTCTLRWSLAGAEAFDVTIPLGTRATADSSINWATTAMAVIDAGQTFVDVAAQATTTGENTAGLVIGQIATIVDPVALVTAVTNTDATSGGGDVESDVELTARILLAPGAFSVAGPIDAYKSFTFAVDTTIEDVSVANPIPGVVVVTFVLEDGEIPGAPLIALVDAALNADEVRPLTDTVTVQAPSEVEYAIDLTYYIAQSRSGEETAIRNAVEGNGVPGDSDYVEGAIPAWIRWQRSAMGRDVNPSRLSADIVGTVESPLAKRLVLTSPAFAVIDTDEIAVVDGDGVTNVTYGGLEAD